MDDFCDGRINGRKSQRFYPYVWANCVREPHAQGAVFVETLSNRFRERQAQADPAAKTGGAGRRSVRLSGPGPDTRDVQSVARAAEEGEGSPTGG